MSSTPAAATKPIPSPPIERLPALLALIRCAFVRGETRPLAIGGACAAVMLAPSFASNLRHFAYTWSTDENYSHGFLVPLLALYFANEAARRGPIELRGGRVIGALLLGLGLFAKVATIVIPVGIVGDVGFLMGLAGVVALTAGRRALARYGFAIGFLVFMIPLPVALYASIASPLQLTVSKVASAILNASGIPVLCQGNLMTLPGGVRMFVAEACSGMRQLTGFLALTTAVAYLSGRSIWHRGLLIASAVPVAMTANVIRVVATGVIMYRFDPGYASGTFHTLEGLVMMGLGLGILWAEGLALDLVFPGRPASEVEPGPVVRSARAVDGERIALRVALIGGMLASGLIAQAGAEWATATTRPPLNGRLSTIPMQLGSWVGHDEAVRADVLRESQADDYLNRVYEDSTHPGRQLTLWINYSEHGLNLRHSPEVCLPSGGWTKVESQCRVIPVDRPAGAATPITRLAYAQAELAQGVGFWYYIFGEGSLERYVRSLPVTSRSSHGRTTRGSGLTVEVFCPVATDPDGEALSRFAAEVLDALEPLLPDERAAYHVP